MLHGVNSLPPSGTSLLAILLIGTGLLVGGLVFLIVKYRGFEMHAGNLKRQVLVSQLAETKAPGPLPRLVQDFAERSGGRVGGPLVVMLTQKAEMRLSPAQSMFDISATQVSGTRNTAFVWHGRGKMGILPFQVLDSYASGIGNLEVRIAGGLTVARATGDDIDRGEAMRFLAELAWNPGAILNAEGLTWRQLDALSVEVSAITNGGAARVTLRFDPAGDIVEIEATDRPRSVGGTSVPTRWVGRFSGYVKEGNYRFARRGEIAWVLPEGEFVYWRGEVTSLSAPVAPLTH